MVPSLTPAVLASAFVVVPEPVPAEQRDGGVDDLGLRCSPVIRFAPRGGGPIPRRGSTFSRSLARLFGDSLLLASLRRTCGGRRPECTR